MQDSYRSGDPYLAFGKQAGAVPSNATKQSHRKERDRFKAYVLGVNYGMGEKTLADRIQQSALEARDLLKKHQDTYQQFWRWSNGALDYAMFYGKLWTVFGWTIKVNENPNPRMLRKFLIQVSGAEMLRLACILVLNEGVNICAPVHGAILIEAPIDELDDNISIAQNVMKQASKIVLGGFGLNTDVEDIKFPNRFTDRRGIETLDAIMDILEKNL
jgi:DNA polymerase I-like protein with 3'-5' exonuclease and polymerase domains